MTLVHYLLRRACLALLPGSLVACQSGPTVAEQRQLRALEATLYAYNGHRDRSNDQTVGYIERAVSRTHWLPKDVAVLSKAQEVKARARAEVQYLRQLRQRLVGAAGTSPADTAPVGALLVPDGAADSLQLRLNAYASFLRQIVPGQVGLLAPDAPQDPRVTTVVGKELHDWRFAEVQFRGASVASALAMLAQQEAEVLRAEGRALQELAKYVGSSALVFDKIGAAAVPQSNTVQEGGTYRATLFLTTTGSEIYASSLTANEQPIEANYSHLGPVQFLIPAKTPAGLASWEGRIRCHYQGRDTTFRLRVPYIIRPR